MHITPNNSGSTTALLTYIRQENFSNFGKDTTILSESLCLSDLQINSRVFFSEIRSVGLQSLQFKFITYCHPTKTDNLEHLGVCGRIILKWILEWFGIHGLDSLWLRIGHVTVDFECGNELSDFIKCGLFARDFERKQISIQNNERRIRKQTQIRVDFISVICNSPAGT